jgi:hypothetical protein
MSVPTMKESRSRVVWKNYGLPSFGDDARRTYQLRRRSRQGPDVPRCLPDRTPAYIFGVALAGLPGFSGFERLGAGGLGDVYVATRDSTGGKVAIKVLRDWSDSSVAWVRTRRELQALVQLQGHPNVVHVEDVLESDGVPHIVMEFAPAGSVDDRCARAGGRLPLADLAVIGENTAAALAAAHRLGILHLDVKPQNLLIGGFGQVKLCDFGISALTMTEEFRQHTRAISSRYASPEQFAEQPVGPTSDVYMLGATLGHLATGILPNQRFAGGADAWAANWPADPPGLAGTSQELFRLVAACTAHDPASRPTAETCRSGFAALANRLLGGRSHVLAEEGATQLMIPAHLAVPGAREATATHVLNPLPVGPPRGLADGPRRGLPVALLVVAALATIALIAAAVVWAVRDQGEESAEPPASPTLPAATVVVPVASSTLPAAGTVAATPTAPPPTTTAAASTTSATLAPTTTVQAVQPAVTAAPATVPTDLTGPARESLVNYFADLRAGDLDRAYTYWAADAGPDYSSFVDWWGDTVEWWDHSIEDCRPASDASICTVLMQFSYGDVECAGARVDLTMVPGGDEFLIARQDTLDDGIPC